MDGGAPTDLEARIRRLETAVSALLNEYETARERLHELEDAAAANEDADRVVADVSHATAVETAERTGATTGREREATQAEVERAVRRAESGDRETSEARSDVVEPNA